MKLEERLNFFSGSRDGEVGLCKSWASYQMPSYTPNPSMRGLWTCFNLNEDSLLTEQYTGVEQVLLCLRLQFPVRLPSRKPNLLTFPNLISWKTGAYGAFSFHHHMEWNFIAQLQSFLTVCLLNEPALWLARVPLLLPWLHYLLPRLCCLVFLWNYESWYLA